MKKYNDYPLDVCIASVKRILATSPGTVIYQKWTCAKCGDRVTGNTPNGMFELGHHEECGHVTNIRASGCNYSVHLSIPAVDLARGAKP